MIDSDLIRITLRGPKLLHKFVAYVGNDGLILLLAMKVCMWQAEELAGVDDVASFAKIIEAHRLCDVVFEFIEAKEAVAKEAKRIKE